MDHPSGKPVGLDLTVVGASVAHLPVQLVLTGELDIATATELDQQLVELLARGRVVELDMSGLTFIDSTGLGVLIRRAGAAEPGGGSVTVLRTDLAPQVLRLIELTGTATILWPEGHGTAGEAPESA